MVEATWAIKFTIADRQRLFLLVEMRLGGHLIATASYYQHSDARWRYEWQNETFDDQKAWAIAALQQIIKKQSKCGN